MVHKNTATCWYSLGLRAPMCWYYGWNTLGLLGAFYCAVWFMRSHPDDPKEIFSQCKIKRGKMGNTDTALFSLGLDVLNV